MKITYTFDHDEDYEKFNVYQQADGMHATLWEFDQELRRVAKYEDGAVDQQYAEKWRDALWRMMQDNNVTLGG